MEIKIFTIIITIALLVSCFANISYAEQTDVIYMAASSETIDDVVSGAKNFISKGTGSETVDEGNLRETSSFIYNIFFACGMVLAVVVGIILGIRFMTSSVEGQAEVKKELISYFVGCVVVFGAFGIWKLVMELMKLLN